MLAVVTGMLMVRVIEMVMAAVITMKIRMMRRSRRKRRERGRSELPSVTCTT